MSLAPTHRYGLGVPFLMALVMYRNRAAIVRDQRLWMQARTHCDSKRLIGIPKFVLQGLGDSPETNFDYRTRRRYARMCVLVVFCSEWRPGS